MSRWHGLCGLGELKCNCRHAACALDEDRVTQSDAVPAEEAPPSGYARAEICGRLLERLVSGDRRNARRTHDDALGVNPVEEASAMDHAAGSAAMKAPSPSSA